MIADDHPFVVFGARRALEAVGIDVVGTANSAPELLKLLGKITCDVILTDYSMPGEKAADGWRLVAALSSAHPQVPIIVYSEFDDPFLVGSLVLRGIDGFVSKRDDVDELRMAVSRVMAGEQYLAPVARDAFNVFSTAPAFERFVRLTRRQMEIAGLMLCGLSVGETARLLGRSVNTISMQRSAACRRLGFQAACDVYRFAASHGLWLDRREVVPRSAACGVSPA